jgi:hypothetical protein
MTLRRPSSPGRQVGTKAKDSLACEFLEYF